MAVAASKFRYSLLFASLLLLLIASPFFERHDTGSTFIRGLFSLVMLAAVYGASTGRRTIIIAMCLAVAWLVLSWVGVGSSLGFQGIAASLVLIVFNIFVFAVVMSGLHRAQKIDHDIVSGALALYLLIAVTWAVTYMVIAWFDPDALKLSTGSPVWHDYLYFSLTTITTLGYGDMVPVSPFARIWSTLEAVTGVLYVAVLIARFVSMYRR